MINAAQGALTKQYSYSLNPVNPLTPHVKLAWYCFEGSGAHLTDLSPNQINGVMGAGVTWVMSDYGPALSFNPALSTSNVTSVTTPVPPLPLAFHLRVKPNVTNPRGIFDSAPNQTNVLRNFDSGQMDWHNANPSLAFTLSTTEWTDILVQYYYDGNRQVRLYKNGQLAGSASGNTSASYAWTTFSLGSINGGSGVGRYNGFIDHCIVFSDYIFNADSVSALHSNPYQLIYRPRLIQVSDDDAGVPHTGMNPVAFFGSGFTQV